MYQNNKCIDATVKSLMTFCQQYHWSEAAMTICKIIISLYTVKQEKWDINFHDVFLLDADNYNNLQEVINFLYVTNKSPVQLFGDEFIGSIIKKYK